MLIEKGKIHENFTKDKLFNEVALSNIKEFLNKSRLFAENIENRIYLEISHKFTPAFQIALTEFKTGAFLSDDAFESLLAFHASIIDGKNLEIYNYQFYPQKLLALNMNEQFDFIFSMMGISFEKIYQILPQIIGLLKVAGILSLQIPAYWYNRENMTDIEKQIIEYSKKNDKKWLFTEPIEPIIVESGAKLLKIEELTTKTTLSRIDLAYISSLAKLHDAILTNNIAHLEVADIPENNIEIRNAIIVIKKVKKTLTKDNLFK